MSDIKQAILENPHLIFEDEDIFRAIIDSAKMQQDGGQIIDLRAALIERLNAKLDAAAMREREVFSTAEENYATLERIHETVVNIAAPADRIEFIDNLKQSIEGNLDVDHAVIVLDDPSAQEAVFTQECFLTVPAGTVRAFYGKPSDGAHSHIKMRLSASDSVISSLFPATRLGSEAVILFNLGDESEDAALVLASRSPETYTEDMSTELLAFFGRYLEQMLKRWLKS